MKKLILSFLAIGATLAAMAQFRPTFVYDDGNIPSGYFYSSTGFGGVYWVDGQGTTPSNVVNYTPYTVTRPGRGTVVTMNSAAPNITFPAKQCNLSGGVNVSAGVFKPFLVVFGNKRNSQGVEDTTKPFTVDISSNPVLKIRYSKPATPASNYYVSGNIINSANGAPGNAYLYNLGNLPSNVTTPGAGSFGGNTAYFGTLGNIPDNVTVAGFGTWNNNYIGNIYGLKSQGCCSPNMNDSPLRVTVQVVDSAGARLEMISTNYNTNSFTNGKLGWTMSTSAENDREVEIDLSKSLVLNYALTTPGAPFSCTAANTCPALKGGSIATSIASASGFRFDKVKQILIFFSGRCAGNTSNLAAFSATGVCNYGPPNFTCYDNTVTITSFSLGNVPAPVPAPTLDSVRFSLSTVMGIYYNDPANVTFDSIIVARSVVSTGGWSIVTKAPAGFQDSNLGGSSPNRLSDYFGITTAVGTVISVSGVVFTTTGVYYYKLGAAKDGRITWGNIIRGSDGAFSTNLVENYIPSASITLAPNPSTGITNLEYSLIRGAAISYKIYNSFGHEVGSSPSNVLAPGTYNESINLTGKTPGIYLVTVFVDGKPAKTSKLVLE